MAKTPKTPARSPATASNQRKPITIEVVRLLAPTEAIYANIARTFALDPVPFDDIRAATEAAIIAATGPLEGLVNERALDIHLQRITGSFVSSAHGAANFYSSRISDAKDATMRLANDTRDEDADGPSGWESRAQRARQFAATAAQQAYSLLAAAEGALRAYEHLTGNTWKPYVADTPAAEGVERKSAAEELGAFG
jgi:hypothetical protein